MPIKQMRLHSAIRLAVFALLILSQTGCQALLFKIKGTPAAELSAKHLAVPKRGLKTIDVTKLGQPKPEEYVLDSGDVIGVYIPGIVPFQDIDAAPLNPPVYYPEPGSTLPPSIGLPFVVLENGKVTLPGMQPIEVKGLTIEKATDKILKAYEKQEIIQGKDIVPLVALFKPRTYSVMVVREDTGQGQDEHAANGATINLPAFQNDVLHALLATGGMPGLRAKNEIKIYRNASNRRVNSQNSDVIQSMDVAQSFLGNEADVVIPLRIYEGETIDLPVEDIILGEGDLVYISNRSAEVFYTAGLLPGGEHQMPRDYDIDIFEAMSIAGYSYGNGQTGGGGLPIPNAGVAPTQLFIFRECPDGTEFTIKVDLEKAICDDRERILVQSGDKLFLRHSPCEETLTFGIFSFFTYGISQVLRR